jgi:hypothetical protein
MKRQHADTNGDLASSSPVKRLTKTESQDNEMHQFLHPANLLRLDLDSLGEVLAYVDLLGMIALCQSSSFHVASVIMSCIHEIDFHPRMPSTRLHAEDAAMRLLLTMIPAKRFVKLKSLVLDIECIDLLGSDHSTEESFGPVGGLRLDEFPPTLTRLALIDVPVEAGRYISSTRLSNLTSVTSLTLNTIKFVTNEDQSHDHILAIIRLLELPTQLLEFECVFHHSAFVRDHALIARALPKTLESLNVDQIVIGHIEHWPSHLTTLGIQFVSDWHGVVNNKPSWRIPASVTRLKFQKQNLATQSAVLHCFKSCFCLADPSTLQHLSFKYTNNTFTDAMSSVSKLTSLKSLKLKSMFDSDIKLDVTMLPKSLRWLDQGSYIKSSQWQHLPPDIQLTCPARMVATPIYIEKGDSDEQLRFLPKSLKHVTVFDRPLPVSLPSLEHVMLSLTSDCVPIPPRSEFELYLVNLPRMLRSLSVGCDDCNDMFWLHNDIDASRFELQFPFLAKFDLTLSRDWPDVKEGQLQQWFCHLPKTIHDLMLRFTYKEVFIEHLTARGLPIPTFDLTGIQLPPFLEVLHVDVRPAILAFPPCLPGTLRELTLKMGDVINTEAFGTLLKPNTHLAVHVFCNGASFKQQNSTTALVPPKVQM